MSNVPTPEPRWYAAMHGQALYGVYDTPEAAFDAVSNTPGLMTIDRLITTTQAEAYADARIQELLHDEAKPDNIKRAEYYGEGYQDGWKAALEQAAKAVIKELYPSNPLHDWTDVAHDHARMAVLAEQAIRALIPQHDNE